MAPPLLTVRRRARWPAAVLAAGVVLAGGTAAGYAVTRPPGHHYGVIPASRPSRPNRPGTARGAGRGGGPRRLAGLTVTGVPDRLRIPAIGVNAAVVPVGVAAGGALQIPADPGVVGWWAGGGAPGQPSGAVILAGHIDSAMYGPGALFRLASLRPGDAVTVQAGGRAYRYRVQALRGYRKTSLPVLAIFGQHVTARLVLISCGGPFDAATGHYLDNLVAYAVPWPAPARAPRS